MKLKEAMAKEVYIKFDDLTERDKCIKILSSQYTLRHRIDDVECYISLYCGEYWTTNIVESEVKYPIIRALDFIRDNIELLGEESNPTEADRTLFDAVAIAALPTIINRMRSSNNETIISEAFNFATEYLKRRKNIQI